MKPIMDILKKLFKTYDRIIIFAVAFVLGLLFSVFLWYIIVFVVGFLARWIWDKYRNNKEKKPNGDKI